MRRAASFSSPASSQYAGAAAVPPPPVPSQYAGAAAVPPPPVPGSAVPVSPERRRVQAVVHREPVFVAPVWARLAGDLVGDSLATSKKRETDDMVRKYATVIEDKRAVAKSLEKNVRSAEDALREQQQMLFNERTAETAAFEAKVAAEAAADGAHYITEEVRQGLHTATRSACCTGREGLKRKFESGDLEVVSIPDEAAPGPMPVPTETPAYGTLKRSVENTKSRRVGDFSMEHLLEIVTNDQRLRAIESLRDASAAVQHDGDGKQEVAVATQMSIAAHDEVLMAAQLLRSAMRQAVVYRGACATVHARYGVVSDAQRAADLQARVQTAEEAYGLARLKAVSRENCLRHYTMILDKERGAHADATDAIEKSFTYPTCSMDEFLSASERTKLAFGELFAATAVLPRYAIELLYQATVLRAGIYMEDALTTSVNLVRDEDGFPLMAPFPLAYPKIKPKNTPKCKVCAASRPSIGLFAGPRGPSCLRHIGHQVCDSRTHRANIYQLRAVYNTMISKLCDSYAAYECSRRLAFVSCVSERLAEVSPLFDERLLAKIHAYACV